MTAKNTNQEDEAKRLREISWNLTRLRDALHSYSNDEHYKFLEYCAANVANSRSQIFQDIFALYMAKGKRGGYFVEFGATDGETWSNTVVLERGYGWTGIVAEPGKIWHDRLLANRKCAIDLRCVYVCTHNRVSFNEVGTGEISTIDAFSNNDSLAAYRKGGLTYEVETVSLLDLLREHQAPHQIDYLSIDTEGSELDILQAFDFTTFEIRAITVEHNFNENYRHALFEFLSTKGYERKFDRLSGFDDWYFKP